jgi:hypothetical protein
MGNVHKLNNRIYLMDEQLLASQENSNIWT